MLSSPTDAASPTLQWGPTNARSPIDASASTIAYAPIVALAGTRADTATRAVGSTPGVARGCGCSSAATRAYVAYGFGDTSRGNDVAPAAFGATITTAARVVASWLRYRGLARNAMSCGPARSRVATRTMITEPSPSSVASALRARSASAMPGLSRIDAIWPAP